MALNMKDFANIKIYLYNIYMYVCMYVSRGVINALGAVADALRPF